MTNRKDRRAQHHAQGRYRPPPDLEYNEFVGELRPSSDRVFTELHISYGVRNESNDQNLWMVLGEVT
jgi:hypothetical protein